MDPTAELTEWLEQFWSEATSFGLEVMRSGDTTYKSWRQGKVEDRDPSLAAQEIVEWARQVRAGKDKDAQWNAFVRVSHIDETGRTSSKKHIQGFMLPTVDDFDNPNALTAADVANNPGLKIFLELVNGERRRTEVSLDISRKREDKLFDTVIHTIEKTSEDRSVILQEMREERKMFLNEMREERQSHRNSIGPILQHSAEALANAAKLVSIHQEKDTQVQLAQLQYQAEKERMEMYLGALPFVKSLLDRKRKRKQPAAALSSQPEDDMPANGPAHRLLSILDRLSEQQLADAKRIIGAKHFDAMYAAAGEDDDATTAALQAFLMAQATATMKNPKDAEKKKDELAALLGEELSKEFVALLLGDDEPEDEPEDGEPEPAATVTELIQPGGFVAGLRSIGWHALDDEKTGAIAELLGVEMTGILVASAEGIDERKAHVALLTFSSRLSDLAKEAGEDAATERFNAVENILGDTNHTFANLMAKALDKMPEGAPEPA